MDAAFYWPTNQDVRGTAQANARGLTNPQPLMRLNPNEGGDMYLFKSGDKFYIWNIAADVVSVITSPVGQDNVLKELGEMAVGKYPEELKTEVVPVLATGDDDE